MVVYDLVERNHNNGETLRTLFRKPEDAVSYMTQRKDSHMFNRDDLSILCEDDGYIMIGWMVDPEEEPYDNIYIELYIKEEIVY